MMDRRETEEVIVNAAQAWVGGQILGALLIAALPIFGWVLLLGFIGLGVLASTYVAKVLAAVVFFAVTIGGIGALTISTLIWLLTASHAMPASAFLAGRALRPLRRRLATKGVMR